MTDFQPLGQNWSEKNPVIGTGEGEVPLANAPMAEVTMRTMSSDIASIKETGGGEPKPYNPQMQSAPLSPSAPQQSAPSTVIPPQTNIGDVAQLSVNSVAKTGTSKTNWFAIIAVLLGVVAIGALGYFFVYQRFVVAPTPTVAPVTQNPGLPVAETPTQTSSTTTTTSESVVPTSTAPQLGIVMSHVSLFKTPADTSSEALLPTLTINEIKNALQSTSVDVPLLKEVVFKSASGVYGLAMIAPVFMPNVFTPTTVAFFQPDATFFTYIDKAGSWPGMIMKLATGADSVAATTAIKNIEATSDVSSLFLTNPGAAATWKDGKVSTFAARYVPFSTKGVALSYAWLNDNLIISTSYAGAQSAAKKLGL